MPLERVETGIVRVVGRYTTSYKATAETGVDPLTGKRGQTSRTFPTLKEARDWRISVMHKRREGTYLEPSDQSLGDYLTEWLATLRTVEPATRNVYARELRQVTSRLGTVPLGELTPAHVDRLVAELVTAGYAPASVRKIHSHLKRALARAVRRRLILSNPADDSELPSIPRTPLAVWPGETARRFLRGAADDPYAALWHLAVATGMRQGELLALGWESIDLERGTLTVERHLSEDDHRQFVIRPLAKTAAGYRQLALSPSLVGVLRLHHYRQSERREAMGAAWLDTGALVFERGDGALMNPNTLRFRFDHVQRALALPRLHVHGLRHTAASLMLTEARLPLFVVSRILGHRNIQTTANIYGWLLEPAQRSAAADVERTLWQPPELGL